MYRILLLFFVLFPCSVHAVPDPLLEQIRTLHTAQGAEGARAAAQGLGILLREDQGQLLVPVIVDRSVERGRSFHAKLKHPGTGRENRTAF